MRRLGIVAVGVALAVTSVAAILVVSGGLDTCAYACGLITREASAHTQQTGLVSHWAADANAMDSVDGNHGSLVGGATYDAGLIGQAFSLDGVDDFVSVPHSTSLDFGTDDFTVALWVKFRTTAGEQVLAEKYIETASPERSGWCLTKMENDSFKFAGGHLGGSGTVFDAVPPPIASDTWHHVAVTHSHEFAESQRQDVFTLYWNCTPIGSVDRIDSPLDLDTSATLKFGHRGNPDDTPGSVDTRGFYLNGFIDDVHVFSRALAWSEIQDICAPYAPVGGIAELPAVAGPSGTSGMGSATYAVLAGAAAGVLAFAVLATLSVKRWRVR